MGRTKTTRRTYTNKKLKAIGNLREAESARVQEPLKDVGLSLPQAGLQAADIKLDTIPDATEPVVLPEVISLQEPLKDIGLSQPQAGLHAADIKSDTIPDPKEPVVLPEEIFLQEPLQGVGLNQPQAELPTTDIKSDTIPDSTEPVVVPEEILLQEPLQDVGLSRPQAGLPTADTKSDTIPNPVEPAIVSEEISLQNSPILDCSFVSRQRQKSGSTLDPRPISPVTQENSPILGCCQRNVTSSLPPSIPFRPISDTHTGGTSFVSPIDPNLAWDSSMKENSQLQANIRPGTPDISNIPVDEIFSPKTQKELRSTIWALFPNGPPPPPPVKPLRRPKKGDVPYIVGCTKRRRVPSPKGLSVFRGDDYGITDKTNCDEDEPYSPAKQSRRAARGTASLSKSRFNPLSDEIAERLKLYEKIDRLLGRTPKEETVGYMSRPSTSRKFSPIPSTSTDSETIMKNDRHFSESLNCDNDNFDIDDDDDLPEIVWETKTSKCKQENITYDCNESPLALLNKHNISDITRDDDINCNDDNSPASDTDNCNDDGSVELDEDLNNNNNNDDVIAIDNDYCEIDFDKLIPKEKLIITDVEEIDVKPKTKPEIVGLKDGYSSAPQGIIPTTSDVICIDDDVNAVTNTVTKKSNVGTNRDGTNASATQEHASTASSSVLRSSNKMPTATEAPPDLVIEVPDVLGHTVNTPNNASASRRPIWNEDIEFVSETKTNEPRLSNSENRENISDVQFVSNIQGNINTARQRNYEILNELQQFFAYLSDSSLERQRKPAKRKNKKPKRQPCHTSVVVNNENTAPTVNQVPVPVVTIQPPTPSVTDSLPKRKLNDLGDCPICLDVISRDFIASTNCGHVFCLDCIKKSLSTTGKRCPTCRKQLKGTGYHQVFL